MSANGRRRSGQRAAELERARRRRERLQAGLDRRLAERVRAVQKSRDERRTA